MSWTVIVSEPAERHIRVIHAWWRRNRPASPDLFRRELGWAHALLCEAPFVGRPADLIRPDVRCLLLRATQYHIYYTANEAEQTVVVHAVWHTARGEGPDL